MSYKTYCHRLAAPLWPSSLGITDKCQYSTVKNVFENQNPKSGLYLRFYTKNKTVVVVIKVSE